MVRFLSPFSQPQITLTIQQQQGTIGSQGGDLEYQAILLIHTLVRYGDNWLSNHPQLVGCLKKLWISDAFQADKSVSLSNRGFLFTSSGTGHCWSHWELFYDEQWQQLCCGIFFIYDWISNCRKSRA